MPSATDELYNRALDEVRRKTGELADVAQQLKHQRDETRDLQRLVESLRHRNTQLEKHAEQLASTNSSLEQRMKAQQLQLQRYLDAATETALARVGGSTLHGQSAAGYRSTESAAPPEAAGRRGSRSSVALRDSFATVGGSGSKGSEMAALTAKIVELEADHRSLQAALQEANERLEDQGKSMEQSATMQSTLDELKQALDTAIAERNAANAQATATQDVLRDLRDARDRQDAELKALEETEHKMKEAYYAEFQAASLECDRVRRELEETERVHEATRAEHSRLHELLEQQRKLAHDSAEISAKEVRGLRSEVELVTEDLRVAVEERDHARAALARSQAAATRATELHLTLLSAKDARAALGIVTIDRGTQVDLAVDRIASPSREAGGPRSRRASRSESPGAVPTRSPSAASNAVAAFSKTTAPDVEALQQLEQGLLEWRDIADGLKQDLHDARSQHRAQLEERDAEMLALGNKAQEVAGRLRSAYTENDRHRAHIAELEATVAKMKRSGAASSGTPLERLARADGSGGVDLRGVADDPWGGTGPRSRASDGGIRTELNDLCQELSTIVEETVVAALHAQYLASLPFGAVPSHAELQAASQRRPRVDDGAAAIRFNGTLGSEFDTVVADLRGLRHVTKTIRSDLWAAAKSRRSGSVESAASVGDRAAAPQNSPPRRSTTVSSPPSRASPGVSRVVDDLARGAEDASDVGGVGSSTVPSNLAFSPRHTGTLPGGAMASPPTGEMEEWQRVLEREAETLRTLQSQVQLKSSRINSFRAGANELRSQR